jgi:hypothetical protein
MIQLLTFVTENKIILHFFDNSHPNSDQLAVKVLYLYFSLFYALPSRQQF